MSAAGPTRVKASAGRLRQPTEVRRRMIVEAARSVIAERGLFATTMRDIAAASGVSLGTVTYHFTGIDEILMEALQKETDSFYSPLVERSLSAPDAVASMQIMIDGFFAGDTRTVQHWRLWLDFWALSAHDGALADWQAAHYRRWRDDIRAVIVAGRDRGEFLFGDVDTEVTEFMALFDGLAVQAYLPGAAIGPAQARAHMRGHVQRRLRAAPGSGSPARR